MTTFADLVVSLPLAAAILIGQEPSDDRKRGDDRKTGQADVGSAKTFSGTIVDANASSKSKAKNGVAKRCQASARTTSFALVTNAGIFFKLNDDGNSKLTSMSSSKKNMKATVTGTVEGDVLKVETLAKR